MSTPTPAPWVADGYDLRQKHGRMIAYFGPHHTPADEYPMSCRLQDEANCQWVAAARNELAAAKAECERLRKAGRDTWGELRQQIHAKETELAQLRADLERFTGDGLLDCHAICDQRDAAVAERDQLRAEVREARRAWLGDDYGHLPLIEALEKFRSDSDAKSDRADVLYQRSCEVEHKLRSEVERLTAVLYHRACEVEPALRAEVERLCNQRDNLLKPMRAAIDAAMKP